MKKQITLLMPGCIPSQDLFVGQNFPHLLKILSRSTATQTSILSYEKQLLNLFSLQEATLPVAALIAFYQGLLSIEQSEYLCCIDFVNFKTDSHSVYLKKSLNNELSIDESKKLIKEIEPFMVPEYSYITTQKSNIFKVNCSTSFFANPLWEMLGKSLHLQLPSGAKSSNMHRLMTEIQMLLNASAINQQRMLNDLLSVDGVWMWGGGQLPKSAKTDFDVVLSNEPYVGGLAKLAQVPFFSLEALPKVTSNNQHEHILIVDTHLQSLLQQGEMEEWQLAMEQYEIKYFSTVQKLFADKRCAVFHFNDGNGKIYSLTPLRRHFFWRNHKNLASFGEADILLDKKK